ncbi:MAG: 3D domain-containing protein [Bacteroidales bacterium]|nr:3D domain-containing protein [Bacteroidales bacterium]
MKKTLDKLDQANKIAFKLCIILFALALLFSGCKVGNNISNQKPIRPEDVVTTETATEEPNPLFDLGEFKLTAYCACKKCCGKWADGVTASGAKVQQGITIAADTDILPFGTNVIINGHEYTVQDRGGAIKGNRIDIYFDSHEDALEFGVQKAEVYKVVS